MHERTNNQKYTAADTTTRSSFKIENPSRGPGRVDFTAPDAGFGLEGTPKPKIQRDLSPQKQEILYVGRRCKCATVSLSSFIKHDTLCKMNEGI